MGKDASGTIAAAISREIVDIYAEYYGRGPTKVQTTLRDDLVVCILQEVFSRAERLLVDGGRFEQVRLNRQAFRDQIEPVFRGAIEAATDKRVEACLGQVNEAGFSAEIFVLSPRMG